MSKSNWQYFFVSAAGYTWPASCEMLNSMFNKQITRAMFDVTNRIAKNKSNESTAQSLDDISSKSQKAYQKLGTSVADDDMSGADDFNAFSSLPYKSDFTVLRQPRGASADMSRVAIDSPYSLVNIVDETIDENTSKSLSSDFNGLSAELEEIFVLESSEDIDFSHTGESNEFSNDRKNQQYNEFEDVTILFHYSRFIVEEVVTEEMKLAQTPSLSAQMDTSMPSETSRGPNGSSEQKTVDYFADRNVTADDSSEKFSLSSSNWSISGKKAGKSSDQKIRNTGEIWKTRGKLELANQDKTFPDSSLKVLLKENGGNKMKDLSSAHSSNLEAKTKTSVFVSHMNQVNQAGRGNKNTYCVHFLPRRFQRQIY